MSILSMNIDVVSRLHSIKHVMLDMVGTIYYGERLFAITKPFLSWLSSLGISFSFLTNNSSKSVEDYLEEQNRTGLGINENALYTSTLFASNESSEKLKV